jgi:mannose-1-phosphate guanylyltransferase
MKAIVLVGGSGTRLRPLTLTTPKALLPVLNRPLISYLLANLRRHGIEEVIFAASAGDLRLEKALEELALGIKTSFSYETEPLGSGLAVRQAARGISSTFLVCNGDIITDLDLTGMLALHRSRQAVVTISLTQVDDPSAFGVVALDEAHRITRFVEKPPREEAPSNYVNSGTWIFEPRVLDYIPSEPLDGSLERRVFPFLIDSSQVVQGFASDAYFMDVGTPERYLQVHRDLLTGACSSIGGSPGTFMSTDSVVTGIVGEERAIPSAARLARFTAVGRHCRVSESAVIEGSVLWDSVEVGDEAIVHKSILGKGCKVGARSLVSGCVLGDGVVVKPGSVLKGERLAADDS